MARRSIGYYRSHSRAPKNPITVTSFVTYKDYRKPETAQVMVYVNPNINPSAFDGDTIALDLDETRKLMIALESALDDADRVRDAAIAEHEKALKEAAERRNARKESLTESV